MTRVALTLVVLFLIAMMPPSCRAQSTPANSANQRETVQDLVARLSTEQKQLFDNAQKSFEGKQYADALAIYKRLLGDLPGDPILSKFEGEAAINAGDPGRAMKTLKPVADADADDWQAVVLLTRACAEANENSCRDAGIAHVQELHNRGVTPPAMQQYILERVKVGDNDMYVRMSIEPWGLYKVYVFGQVMNGEGKIFLRIALESSDTDQPRFAKEHPEEAAKGMRRFSLDAYLETGLNSNGQRTLTQYLYKFFDGQPPYESLRGEFIKVASGKATALSSRTNLVVP